MDDVAVLVAQTFVVDEVGNQVPTDERLREVFVQVENAGSREYFAAGAQGLKPEYKLLCCAYDYDGEELVLLHGVPYTVYRTYRPPRGDRIELYLTQKGCVVSAQC